MNETLKEKLENGPNYTFVYILLASVTAALGSCFFGTISNFIIDMNNKMLALSSPLFADAQAELEHLRKANAEFANYFILLSVFFTVSIAFLIYFNTRELHDTVAQDMRYVSFLAGKISDEELREKIQEGQKNCINQVRFLCYNLSPLDIKNNDLIGAIKNFCADTQEQSKINVSLTVKDDVDFSRFNEQASLNIYRIIQECVLNSVKHSESEDVSVLIRNAENESGKKILRIVVSDDGKGMDRDILAVANSSVGFIRKDDGNHFGIKGIRERTKLLGGTAKFKSEEDCGVEVVIDI